MALFSVSGRAQLNCSGGPLNCNPPLTVALGGTNATGSNLGTTNGIVTYDGTRLKNQAGFLWDGTTVTLPAGSSCSALSTNFTGSTQTGFYLVSAGGRVALCLGNNVDYDFIDGQLRINNGGVLGLMNNFSTPDTYVSRTAAGVIGVGTTSGGSDGTLKSAIAGTTTNDSAAAGNVGEYISATVTTGSAVTVATGSATPITSISLTAGDWDVTGVVDYNPNAATSVTTLAQGSQALNGCMTSGPALGAQDTFSLWETAANIIGASSPAWGIPVTRISIASTTTVCLIAKATFSVNTLTAYGTIRARRIR